MMARTLVFLAAFTLEIRVKAAEIIHLPNASEVLEEPAGCLMDSTACAVRTSSGEKYELPLGDTVVHMDRSTAVLRVRSDEIRLVAGTVWIEAKGPFTVRTEFGAARVGSGGFWVTRTEDRMTAAAAVGSDVVLAPRGTTEELVIERGMENWIGRVGRQGHAESGLPRAIPFDEHVRRWARLYPGPQERFEAEVRRFRAQWNDASRKAAELHRALLERKVASLRADHEKRERDLRRIEARNRELREMFRRRVLGDE